MRQAYLAGKYTGTPEETLANVLRAVEAAPRVIVAGFLPIIPHTMGPHRNQTWEGAMERCRELIRGLEPSRDVVVLLPGWEESRGAREERILAAFHGIETIRLEDFPPFA